jgi:MSHA pilin protein MshC
MRQSGFNLIELTVTILILGILAVAVLPRFFDRRDFDTLQYYDQVRAAVRYAQKVAIAQHTNVFVIVAATSLSACFDAGCGTRVIDPSTGNGLVLTAPSGVTLSSSAASFSFGALGNPSVGAAVTITVNGSPPRSLTVEPETGYVH